MKQLQSILQKGNYAARISILLVCMILSIGFSACSDNNEDVATMVPTDDASLLKSQQDIIRTRSTGNTIVTMVTTTKEIKFTVENNSPIIVYWGDGGMDLNTFTHTYTDDLLVHTITFEGSATALTKLHCNSNEVIFIDVAKTTSLLELACSENRLTDLNITQNTNLKVLYCYSNHLKTLNLTNNTNLIELACHNLEITNLDLTKNTKLEALVCSNNNLPTLDISQNILIKNLVCDGCEMSLLKLGQNRELKIVYCENNQLTTLNFTNSKKLEELYCESNKLTNLILSANNLLSVLNCQDNQLPLLLPSPYSELSSIWCWNNPFEADQQALGLMINALPDRTGLEGGSVIFSGDILSTSMKNLCDAKNWHY